MHTHSDAVKPFFMVVDDHEAILQGTVPALQKAHPEAEILTATTYAAAVQLMEEVHPELMVVDLSLPEDAGAAASPDVGLKLIERLLKSQWAPNIAVLSTDINPLVRLKTIIRGYEGGLDD